jgi:hypothetical protein
MNKVKEDYKIGDEVVILGEWIFTFKPGDICVVIDGPTDVPCWERTVFQGKPLSPTTYTLKLKGERLTHPQCLSVSWFKPALTPKGNRRIK